MLNRSTRRMLKRKKQTVKDLEKLLAPPSNPNKDMTDYLDIQQSEESIALALKKAEDKRARKLAKKQGEKK